MIPASVFALSLTYGDSASAQDVDPVKAISTFYDAQRRVLGFEDSADNKSKHWLSLSIVGAVADKDDPASINDLANFCPTAQPNIESYARVRKLDGIYNNILGGMTGPLRPTTEEYKAALALLEKADNTFTDLFVRYGALEKVYLDAAVRYKFAESKIEKAKAENDIRIAERNWRIRGQKQEVDAALFVLRNLGDYFGNAQNEKRKQLLDSYKRLGLDFNNGDIEGAYKSPRSEVSPKVETWEQATDWVNVSFSQDEVTTDYDATNTQKRKFAFGSLGFLQLGVNKGNGNSTETRKVEVSKFSYSFDIGRVTIRRPWLDTEVFYQPQGWTWKKADNTPEYPQVSPGPDSEGVPKPSTVSVYNNVPIDCTLLPTEMVIARNRNLIATVSKDSYASIVSSGSSGGGGGFFGIFGGKKKTWSTTKIDETSTDVTFKIEAPSIAVIGLISEKLPILPEPNLEDKWPQNAWLVK